MIHSVSMDELLFFDSKQEALPLFMKSLTMAEPM